MTLDAALQQAIAHHQAGRLHEAEQLYRAILQADPNQPDANHNIGVLAGQFGQHAAGLPHLKIALALKPAQGQYSLSYADALLATGQAHEALSIMQAALQRGFNTQAAQAMLQKAQAAVLTAPATGAAPTPAEKSQLIALFNAGHFAELENQAHLLIARYPASGFLWSILGGALHMQGKNALPALQKTAELMPDDAAAHNNLGNALKELGQLDGALASYQRALEIKPDLAQAHSNLGSVFLELGQFDDARERFVRAVALQPDFADAHYNLANSLRSLGRLDEAAASYKRALDFKPDWVQAHGNLGNVLQALGQHNDAIACYRHVLEIQPDNATAHFNLGNVLRDNGQLDAAVTSYQRALQFDPDCAETHLNLGTVLKTMGQLDGALQNYRRALQVKPDLVDAHINMGNTLKELDQADKAIECYRRALEIDPGSANAHSNLSTILRDFGRFDEALASCRRALEIDPEFAEAHSNLGNVLRDLGQFDAAAASYRRALAIRPDYAQAHGNLGNVLLDLGQLDDAVASLRQAIALKPDFSEAHSNLGSALRSLGKLDEAVASLHRALEIKPNYPAVHSNLLFIHNYLADQPADLLLAASLRFGDIVARQARPFLAWPKACTSDQCLRIGIVSGDLSAHPVGYFVESVLAALASSARSRVELIAYPTVHKEDALTARIKGLFSAWTPLAELNDETAAHLIHSDGVHVLIDLSGHTAGNRLPLFAWKPAPVQVSWLGYFATTGVSAIDYLIADPWTLPSSEEQNFTEKIWRLPETRLCFTEPDVPVSVSPLPALSNHYVTFGCFNNLAKMNDRVVALRSRVLHAVPNSRLLLKATQFHEPSMRTSIVERYAACGINADRLVMEGASPRAEYLAAYHRMDIALDPFPYTGGTTSAEGLWMGVPVLTLAGERFLSRQGVGLLMNAGLPGWIATDEDDYVARAVSLTGDLHHLATLRQQLRAQVLASPLFDAPRFARHFEAALRGMWTAFIHKTSAAGAAV